MTPNNLDPVNAAIALLAAFFGQTLAGIIGPYAVILIASTVGAAWSLGRREPSTRGGAVGYFVLINATALLVTANAARALGAWLGHADSTWLLAPIALLVGGIGSDWPRIGRWALERAGRVIDSRTGGGSNNNGGAQ